MDYSLFSTINQLIGKDIANLNSYILNCFNSEIGLINNISEHIISSGGKRLRPIISILAAKSCGYQGEQHAMLAAIIEILHTATLLHDDVVDKSQMRRGKKTAHILWGNSEAVLVGDFLYSRAFQLMVGLNNNEILNILAEATNKISEGEVLQLINVNNANITEDEYIAILQQKTAMLFQAASHSAAILANAPEAKAVALKKYGSFLGIAFQIADDLLDYTGDVNFTGKKIGDDFADGKITLPIIYLLNKGNDRQKRLIKDIFTNQDRISSIKKLIDEVYNSNAINYTRSKALYYSAQAKKHLLKIDETEYRDLMQKLITFTTTRIS